MSFKIVTVLTVLAFARAALCNDLRAGFPDPNQRLIFEQEYDYNPSIYVRSETVNVETHGNEVISQIEVTDKREIKDGEATIIAGGVGQKFVTIQLKGPAVFRGMTFLVRVYAVNGNQLYKSRSGDYSSPYARSGYEYDTQVQQQQYDGQYAVKG